MDGNRRWAHRHGLPKSVGHARGAKQVRTLVEACAARGVRWLTLFAFSTENWKRPADEVAGLMSLFLLYLQKEASDMHRKGVKIKIVGDRSAFDARLQKLMASVEALTADNTVITVHIAANYGGRWDMLQAVKAWQASHLAETLDALTEDALRPYLSFGNTPDPELIIRSGGEQRLSNFTLWQGAYAELYFTPTLWPDFGPDALDEALDWFAQRDRRFGAAEGTAMFSPPLAAA